MQLDGAAMTAAVYLNGEKLAEHKGGYSTFRVDLTDHLKEENLLAISVDNRDNDTVYPQKADFTFYGGIYRDVTLHIVPAEHFALPAHGAPALKVTPIVTDLAAKTAEVTVEAAVVGAQNVTFALEVRPHRPGGKGHRKGCFHAEQRPSVGWRGRPLPLHCICQAGQWRGDLRPVRLPQV